MTAGLLKVLDSRLERLGILLLGGKLVFEVDDNGVLGVDLQMCLVREKRKGRCSNTYFLRGRFDSIVKIALHLDGKSGFNSSVMLEAEEFELKIGLAGL